MIHDEEMVAQTFRDYIQAFQSLRAPAVLSYFQIPFVLIADGGMRALADAGALEAFVGQLMDGLKARDFSRSEITDMRVHRMSEKLALVSSAGSATKMTAASWSGWAKPTRSGGSITVGKSPPRSCTILG